MAGGDLVRGESFNEELNTDSLSWLQTLPTHLEHRLSSLGSQIGPARGGHVKRLIAYVEYPHLELVGRRNLVRCRHSLQR